MAATFMLANMPFNSSRLPPRPGPPPSSKHERDIRAMVHRRLFNTIDNSLIRMSAQFQNWKLFRIGVVWCGVVATAMATTPPRFSVYSIFNFISNSMQCSSSRTQKNGENVRNGSCITLNITRDAQSASTHTHIHRASTKYIMNTHSIDISNGKFNSREIRSRRNWSCTPSVFPQDGRTDGCSSPHCYCFALRAFFAWFGEMSGLDGLALDWNDEQCVRFPAKMLALRHSYAIDDQKCTQLNHFGHWIWFRQ